MSVRLRQILFVILAAFITLGPMLPQVFGVGTPWLRPWTMYKGLGTGLLKGEFSYISANGQVTRLTPLEILGEDHYYQEDWFRYEHLIRDENQMYSFAAKWCASKAHTDGRLDYSGRVGVGDGAAWAQLEMTDLCKSHTEEMEIADAGA